MTLPRESLAVEEPAQIAHELRRAFDLSFERPAGEDKQNRLRFVLLRAGGQRYTLPLEELAAIHRVEAISPLPSASLYLLCLALQESFRRSFGQDFRRKRSAYRTHSVLPRNGFAANGRGLSVLNTRLWSF